MNPNPRAWLSESLVWTLYFLGSLTLISCGGRAVDSEQGSQEHEAQGRPSSDSKDGDTPSPDAPSLQQLGECKGGRDFSEGACPWIDGDGSICFPTKEDACACLCPLDRDSVCVSGFYGGEDGQTPVYCN